MHKSAKSWWRYIVRCADGSLYTGITTDVERRVAEHNAGPRGAKYTRGRRPVLLVYVCAVPWGRAWAQRQERRIKAMSKADRERLVGSGR